MSPGVLLVARALHIFFGVLWVGGIAFLTLFVLPSVQAAGPAGGAVMKQMVEVRKVPNIMMALAILTLLTGLTMFWSDARGSETWMSSPFGRTISVGASLAIVAMALGMGISAPTVKKIGRLTSAAQGTPDAATAAELQRLQKTMMTVTRVVLALLFLAVLAMASARYV